MVSLVGFGSMTVGGGYRDMNSMKFGPNITCRIKRGSSLIYDPWTMGTSFASINLVTCYGMVNPFTLGCGSIVHRDPHCCTVYSLEGHWWYGIVGIGVVQLHNTAVNLNGNSDWPSLQRRTDHLPSALFVVVFFAAQKSYWFNPPFIK
eukprot:scaffold638_cov168-Amphora_coffeaeformis.AAC.45